MTGTRPRRRTALVAAVLAGLLALSAVAGTAGLGLADGSGDRIVRNGDSLTVRLGGQQNATTAKEITVRAADGSWNESWNRTVENATSTFTVPVGELSSPKRDLRSVNVTVETGNGTRFTEREDLRLLAFGKNPRTNFAADGSLHVHLQTALGYDDGTGVAVALDGNRTVADGTVEYSGKAPHLAVSLDAANLSLPVPKRAEVTVPARNSSVRVPLRSLVRDATNVTPNGGTVAVTNPLFAPRTDYALSVRTDGPSGQARYAATDRTDGDGAFTVSTGALADAENLTVSAYRNGTPVFEGASPDLGPEEPNEANVTANGTRVELRRGSLDAANGTDVTVWITNGSRYVNATAAVADDGTVLDLRSTEYRLHPNGSYRLLVTDGASARVNVTSNSTNGTATLFYSTPGTDGSGPNADDSSGSLLDATVVGIPLVLVGGGGVLLLGGLVVLVSSVGPGRGLFGDDEASGGETHNLTVTVRKGDTRRESGVRDLFEDEVTVTAKESVESGDDRAYTTETSATDDRETVTATVTDGKKTIELPEGKWDITAETERLSDPVGRDGVRVLGDSSITLGFGPREVEVTVRDDEGDPVPDADVTCRPDTGQSNRIRSDSRRDRFEVPVDASEVELSATCEKYSDDRTTVTFDGDATAEASLTLRQLTGGLEVRTTVDGTAIPGVRVTATPLEPAMERLGERERSETTDETGVVAFEDLVVGRYEVRMALPNGGDAFRTPTTEVEVRDGRTATPSLDAAFEYDFDRRDRDRIAEIRREVEALSSASGRDVAIPRYYGTVVDDLLDAVERIPHEGHRFASADADPEAVVAALLDVTDETATLVGDAMTTKRNTDLFGACADLPDRRVEWTGRYDLDDLFDLLEEDISGNREKVFDRLSRVDERIDSERSDLAVVEPAREPWERTKEFATSGHDGPVRRAAVTFTACGLLEAIDELFDHEELRKRLERTVF